MRLTPTSYRILYQHRLRHSYPILEISEILLIHFSQDVVRHIQHILSILKHIIVELTDHLLCQTLDRLLRQILDHLIDHRAIPMACDVFEP